MINVPGFLSFFIKPYWKNTKNKVIFLAPESISENAKKGLRFLSFLCDDRGEGKRWGDEKVGV